MSSLVSIMLPFKNAQEWISECVQSIINQTYTYWELLCIDDASQDNSKSIIAKYAITDSRIKIYTSNGKGIASACHTALHLAQGNYLHRMDADDVMPSNKLQVLVALQGNRTNYISTGNVQFFAAKEHKIGKGTLAYAQWLNTLNNQNNHWQHIWRECVIANPCWLMLRADALKLNLFAYNIYPEDYDMVLSCYAANFNIVASTQILHYWRHHTLRTSLVAPEFKTEQFLQLKVNWFCKLYKPTKIIVLGTGKKAKLIVPLLRSKNIAVTWACMHLKSHGNKVLGLSYNHISKVDLNQQLVISTLSGYEDYSQFYASLQKKGAQLFAFC